MFRNTHNINVPLVLLTCYCFRSSLNHRLCWNIDLSYIQEIKRLKNHASGLTRFSPLTSNCMVYVTLLPTTFHMVFNRFPGLDWHQGFPTSTWTYKQESVVRTLKSIMKGWKWNFDHIIKPAKYPLCHVKQLLQLFFVMFHVMSTCSHIFTTVATTHFCKTCSKNMFSKGLIRKTVEVKWKNTKGISV